MSLSPPCFFPPGIPSPRSAELVLVLVIGVRSVVADLANTSISPLTDFSRQERDGEESLDPLDEAAPSLSDACVYC